MTTVKWDKSMAVRCLARCGPVEGKTYIPAGFGPQVKSKSYTADVKEAYTSDETKAYIADKAGVDTDFDEMQIDIPSFDTGVDIGVDIGVDTEVDTRADTDVEELKIDIPEDEDIVASRWNVFKKSIDKTLAK